MDEALERTIIAIHRSPRQCAIVAAGTGSQALAWLIRVPGASHTLLEARLPYARASLRDFLGQHAKHCVSAETATAMARWSLSRALELREGDVPVLGVGCTGALSTTRPRRGMHGIELAILSPGGGPESERQVHYALRLEKGARARGEEEEACSLLLIHALALACGVIPGFTLPLLAGDEVRHEGDLSPLTDLLQGRARHILISQDGSALADAMVMGGVLPGAFNPLHEGHRRLAEVASELLRAPVTFELSVENVDKRALTEEEALRRAQQFWGWAPVALTRAPTFREKARLFPGCTFIVGYDTAVRIVAERYYASAADMQEALREIRDAGCHFLVAGRAREGTFHTLADVPLPEEFRSLFQEIPPALFRLDLSSTELRARQHDDAVANPERLRPDA
jgi:hypothetical protein